MPLYQFDMENTGKRIARSKREKRVFFFPRELRRKKSLNHRTGTLRAKCPNEHTNFDDIIGLRVIISSARTGTHSKFHRADGAGGRA